MTTTISDDFKRELVLTIENTERLYKKALEVNDFSKEAFSQIDMLLADTKNTIHDNGGKDEKLATDTDVHEAWQTVENTVRKLQAEAKK